MIKKTNLVVLSLWLLQNLLFAAEPLMTQNPKTATNFTLSDLENKEFSLSDFKGKPVVLFFWTTWCPHCRKELRLLNNRHAELLKNGVELVTINVQESLDRVQRFTQSYSFSYKVLLDTDAEVAESYAIAGVPTYILINKEGRIVFDNHYFPEREYKELILK